MGCLKRVNNNRLYRLFHSEFIMRYPCTECTCNLHIELCGIGRERERERGRYSHVRTKMQSHLFFVGFCDRQLECVSECVSPVTCIASTVLWENSINFRIYLKSRLIKLWKENFFERQTTMREIFFLQNSFPFVFWQFLRRQSNSKRIGHT